jgi:hypothetical protein
MAILTFASDRNFIPARRMVSWPFSSFPVLFEIGTSFQQPEWIHGAFSASPQIDTSFQQQEQFHGDFNLCFR